MSSVLPDSTDRNHARWKGIPAIVKPSRWRIRCATVALAVAMGACTQAPPRDADGKGAVPDDDPWTVRGSVEVGPTYNRPHGPYSPKP